MYLKSMVIDGFKSYGHRTEINGFDREFNAITGLNGSGKSNILDAICFVLGITNLVHARQDKTRQDKTRHHRSKLKIFNIQYLIDELFLGTLQKRPFSPKTSYLKGDQLIGGQAGITKASVTLTFDNRDRSQSPLGYEEYEDITVTRQVVTGGKNKYLINGSNVQNNRVKDLFCSVQLNILAMIEEAAGTRMYECKKQQAQKTIEKKDAKLKELNAVINEEISPKLQKLQDERSQYLEYQKMQRELEHLTRFYVAWQYTKAEEIGGQTKDKLESAHNKIANIKQKDEASLASKEGELKNVEGLFTKLKDTDKADAEALTAAQRKFQAVSAGLMASDDGADATLQDQLMAVKQEVAQAQTEAKQSQMQLQHCQTELNDKQQEMKQTATDYQKDKKNLENMEKELTKLQNELSQINYEDGHIERLQEERRKLVSEIRNLKEKVETFEASFQYRDPERNFNRASVKGLVCKLFKMKDANGATALETAAGGRLFNVIVDNEVTAKKLLQNGQLTRRTTIIPLNKIVGHSIDQRTISLAEQLVGKENVQPALSLINYKPELHPAMQWIFGQTFICKDMETAKKVTFHERILKRSVTLDGDVFDPTGTLSGEQELNRKEQRVSTIDNDIQKLTKAKDLENKVKNAKAIQEQALKNAEKEMNLLKKKAEQSRAQWTQREQEFETLNLEIKELKSSIETGHTQIQAAQETIEQLKQQSEELKKEVDDAKAAVQELQTQVKQQKGTVSSLNKEIQQISVKKEKIVKENGDSELELKKLDHEVTNIQSEAKECQAKEVVMTSKRMIQEKLANGWQNFRKRVRNWDELDQKKKEALRKAWEQVNKDFGSIFSTLLPGADARLNPPEGMDVLDGLEVKVAFGGVWKESLGELSGGQRSLVALSLILAMLLFKPAPIYILDEVDAALDLSHTQNIGNMLKSHFKSSQVRFPLCK
ncbi:Structural maintenance of chromosomes protein 2 [Blattella germanica]|nr:Structural maintenance of chromosomes protein 2 [Blattella germanica]